MKRIGRCKHQVISLLGQIEITCFWLPTITLSFQAVILLVFFPFRIKPRLADPSFKPQKNHILATLEKFKNVLRIRYSSPLFRLKTANAIQVRTMAILLGSKYAIIEILCCHWEIEKFFNKENCLFLLQSKCNSSCMISVI